MDLRVAKRTLSVSVATTALISAAVAVSPPARSATFQFTRTYCNAGSTFWISCDAFWEGGADPATALWSNGTNSWVGTTRIDPANHHTWVDGNCIPNTLFTVKVTVTDATGQSITATVPGGRACR